MIDKNKELVDELQIGKASADNLRLPPSLNDKLEDLNFKIPYLRNNITAKIPASKTFAYNTDDSFDTLNRISVSKVSNLTNV